MVFFNIFISRSYSQTLVAYSNIHLMVWRLRMVLSKGIYSEEKSSALTRSEKRVVIVLLLRTAKRLTLSP